MSRILALALWVGLLAPPAHAIPFLDDDDRERAADSSLFAIPPFFVHSRTPERELWYAFPLLREKSPQRDGLMVFPFFIVEERRGATASRQVSLLLGLLDVLTERDQNQQLVRLRRSYLIIQEDWHRDSGARWSLLGIPLMRFTGASAD